MEIGAASAVLLTAAVLGFTHGIEPDHAAGIASLTSETDGSRRSALVGGCFAAGHVVLVLAWIGVAALLFGSTAIPAVAEEIGTVVLGVVLVLLSALLGLTGVRTFVHAHPHSHAGDEREESEGGERHRHFHLYSPLSGANETTAEDRRDHGHADRDHHSAGATAHTHAHGVRSYLRVGLLGALFTLSPPLSMLAFVSVIVGNVGTDGALLAVSVYALAITATMASVGGGVGLLFGAARRRSKRVHASLQVGSAAIVLALGAYFLQQGLASVAVL